MLCCGCNFIIIFRLPALRKFAAAQGFAALFVYRSVAVRDTLASLVNMSSIKNWSNFCFTEFDDVKWQPTHENIQYCIWQRELSPTTHKQHLQGYMQLMNARPMAWIKNNLFKTAHLEIAKGDCESNQAYCSKEASRDGEDAGPWEYGTAKKQGKRSDLDAIIHLVNQKKELTEIVAEIPSALRYLNNVKQLIAESFKERTTAPKVIYIYGAPGTGKSTYVFNQYGRQNVYVKDDTMWWNGYRQQKVVLMDDCDLTKWERSMLIRMWDQWPLQVQTKGGFIHLNSPYIIITSNVGPTAILNDDAIHRRFDDIIFVNDKKRQTEAKRNMKPIREISELVVVKQEDEIIVIDD